MALRLWLPDFLWGCGARPNYTAGVLTLPDTGAATTLTVPAATFTQNTTTGVVSVTPGVTTVVVTGTI